MNRAPSFELSLARRVRAPRESVFDAFVMPQRMGWMSPRGMTCAEIVADARVGGRFRITMRAKDGEKFVAFGEYREVVRPERLVYTWQWEGKKFALPAETLITVSFSERDGATEVRMRHTGFVDAAARDLHNGGWGSCFNRLVDSLDVRGSAATVTLLGDPRSTHVRTARMGLAEKGVKYTLEPHDPHTPQILAVHPFGRIPAFRDGEIELFETSAILRYVEEAFEGPSLLPNGVSDRARCEQWVSAANSYLRDAMLERYVEQYFFPKREDGQPDRVVIDAALKDIASQLAVLDRAYGGRDFLVGGGVSMADLFLAPMLAYVEAMPEGEELLAKAPNVRRAQAVMHERASFRDTDVTRRQP